MRGGVVLLALALCGCEQSAATDFDSRRIGEITVDVEQLKSEVNQLKDDLAFEKKYTRAISASLEEARANHTALLKTFNKNVDIDNGRNDAVQTQLGNCGKEWIQGDQGWVTVNRDCSKAKRKPASPE